MLFYKDEVLTRCKLKCDIANFYGFNECPNYTQFQSSYKEGESIRDTYSQFFIEKG